MRNATCDALHFLSQIHNICQEWCSQFPSLLIHMVPILALWFQRFLSHRFLAVNLAASQESAYGRFYTSYKSQHGISETSEGEMSTAGVLALLFFFFLFFFCGEGGIRDDNFLFKRKSLISLRICAHLSIYFM